MKRIAIKAGFAVSALSLAVSQGVMATELRFDGFASFVAGQVLDKDELVEESFRGYDEKLGYQANSLFALQARADLQDNLSATAQVIAKGADDYEAKFNWAYLAYQLSNELTIKAGRFRTPLFLYSDFLDVGYAYHWISPPDSVYNLSGFDSSDGVMLEYQTDLAGWTSTATLASTRTNTAVASGTLDAINGWTAAWTLNYDWFTFHIAHSESDVTVDAPQFNQLADGLSQFGVSQEAIDDLLLESDRGTFDGVGIGLDNGTLFAVAEYTEVASEDSFSANPGKRWYVSGGFRFGAWTTYATVENEEADIQEEQLQVINDELAASYAAQTAFIAGLPLPPEQIAAAQAQLTSGYQQLVGGTGLVFASAEADRDTYSVGVRYNFHPSAAAKLEFIQQDDKVNEVEPQAVAVAIDLVY